MLEAQLAALSRAESDAAGRGSSSGSSGNEGGAGGAAVPMPSYAGTFTSSRRSSSSDLRERTASAGKFEEIDMPNELEGYEMGRSGADRGPEGSSIVQSWFGWKGGYDRVKTD